MADILEKLKNSGKDLFVGVAGPGTGKSTAFKTIVNSDDFKGKKILILSFINKLIDDLSNDFKDFDNVTVSTLHSFAMKQIEESDLEQNLDNVITEDYLYLREEELDFAEKLHLNSLAESEEEFYNARRDFYKNTKPLYSLNSIIYEVNKIFSHDEAKIPSKYDLILIDEFQDFNNLEFEFIKFLNKKSKMIIVGDDNQSLYFFKKAEPKLIRDLFQATHTEEFSLDHCYRCTEVIVNTTNDLVKNAKEKGYLQNGLDKKFLYPVGVEAKDEISRKFPKIDFMAAISGDLLIYKIESDIRSNLNKGEKKRILILVPSYLKQTIYDGLIKKGFNIVDFELFSDERLNRIKHKVLIDTFKVLTTRKTDNLCLRKILDLYMSTNDIKDVINQSKKIWLCLPDGIKAEIEADIKIFNKVRKGKDALTDNELLRFNKIFNLKNLLSRMIKGFSPVIKNAIEVEITTVMSSKGLSAEYVYYVGVDDETVMDRNINDFTDHSICEFLVGITRAKEKLTLISMKDSNPKILDFINPDYINRVEG